MSSKLRNLKFYSPNSKKKFYLMEGINRPVSPNHVTKLAKSLNMMGDIRPIVLIRTSIITGIERDYILDGQHLYHACLRNNQEFAVSYNEANSMVEIIEQIAALNASSKSWTMLDYIGAWGNVNPDYKTLMKVYNTYDLDLLQVAAILSGGIGHGGQNTIIIKSGNFKIRNYESNIKLLDYITDALKLVPRMNRFQNRDYIGAYVSFVRSSGKDYNHKAFMIWGEKNKSKLILATQSREHISDLLLKSL